MKLSIVTVCYPSVLPFIKPFFLSLMNQTDSDFDLWIGLDALEPSSIISIVGDAKKAKFVEVPFRSTTAGVRNTVLKYALEYSDAVVLVDSDDVLLETRVEFAKASVDKNDLTATAMRYIDQEGNKINGIFDPVNCDPDLLKSNAYGFTNTTWRTDTLKKLLPVPVHCVLDRKSVV